MDREAVYTLAKQLMEGSRAHPGRERGYILHHGLRVAREAIDLNRCLGLGADDELLWAAGLFHDAGKGLEPHWLSSRALVMEHLAPLAGSPATLEAVAYLVRYHAKRSDPALLTPELRLLQDADILDHRGCMQIWLAIGGAVASGGEPGQVAEEWSGQLRRKRRDEFRQMLHFEESRQRFDRRLALEMDFYAALNAEIAGQECPDKEKIDG